MTRHEYVERVIEPRIQRENELYHHGILGMKWGIRRYQNEDGSLTPEGERRYYKQYQSGKNISRMSNFKRKQLRFDDVEGQWYLYAKKTKNEIDRYDKEQQIKDRFIKDKIPAKDHQDFVDNMLIAENYDKDIVDMKQQYAYLKRDLRKNEEYYYDDQIDQKEYDRYNKILNDEREKLHKAYVDKIKDLKSPDMDDEDVSEYVWDSLEN